MKSLIIPIILAGGSGNRLWPLSREHSPKQLLSLISNHSLLQDTLIRVQQIENISTPIVVTNEEYRFIVAQQLQEIGIKAEIILEPDKKNTAPAVTIAALHAKKMADDPYLLVLPSDHFIDDVNLFRSAIHLAISSGDELELVTFGIPPSKPETGYGYIRVGHSSKEGVFHVAQFVEKPDHETAMYYCQSGEYLWNSGMFFFKASTVLDEIMKHMPQIYTRCFNALTKAKTDLDFLRLDEKEFLLCPSESIDCGLMEKTSCASVIKFDAGWSDLGSWMSFWELGTPDKDQNISIGKVISHKSSNCYLRADKRLLATVGVKDHIIIETSDAVLVAHKKDCQSIKNIVSLLKENNCEEAFNHEVVYRPWGNYEIMDIGDGYRVKLIKVKPGQSLALQQHRHRSEHWIVVKGYALVQRGDEVINLGENESTFIPNATKHRLSNPGITNLELIEVQTGKYLGEDDIIRYGAEEERNLIVSKKNNENIHYTGV